MTVTQSPDDARILSRVKALFAGYGRIDSRHDLEAVAEYYSYLADHINYEMFEVSTSRALLETFEAVFLWLKDELKAYPDAIGIQVEEIMVSKRLCEVFGVIATISDDHLMALSRRNWR